MPLTGYLKIDDIAGESRRVDHEDEIDVTDVAWGVEQAAPASVGRGRSRARATVDDLVCTKHYDASSPYLALASMQGKSLPEAVLSVRKDSGDAHLDYLTITMRNVVVARYEVLGAGDDGRIRERVALAFERITIRYVEQSDDHAAGDEHEVEYDVAAGA